MMHLTIGKKLFTTFGALVLLTLLMGGVAIENVGSLGESIQTLGHRDAHLLYLAGDINYLSADLLSTTRAILTRGYMKDPAKVREYDQRYEDDIAKARRELTELLDAAKDPEVRDLAQTKLLGQLDALNTKNAHFSDLVIQGQLDEAQAVFTNELRPLAVAMSNAGDHLAQRENAVVAARADRDIAFVGPARVLSIAMICLSLLVGVVVVNIVHGINRTLNDNISELRDGAEQITNAASQVSSSSQSLAQGASEQAASLEETSASSEEINSMARKNTDNSRSTAQLLSQSHNRVIVANGHLTEMEDSMMAISESSEKISKIIKVIDDIAFQTNILALNAAVEAARAGESGMGFAVVADEVRSLAQRSAQAAKDTAELIEDSIAKSVEGKGKVGQVAIAIRAVAEDSAKVKLMIDEVSQGSQEQSKGIEQISRAISQMEQVTQTTAASAEESAAAAEELNAQSQAMREVVTRIQLMVGEYADRS